MDIKKSKMAESIKYKIADLAVHSDPRGWLAEMLKADELEADQAIQQIYVATIEPGNFRGGHYHEKRIEWFFVIGGQAEIVLEDIKTKERKIVELSPAKPQRITIYPEIAHTVINKGEKTIYLISAQNNIYDPQNPDTFEYKIYL